MGVVLGGQPQGAPQAHAAGSGIEPRSQCVPRGRNPATRSTSWTIDPHPRPRANPWKGKRRCAPRPSQAEAHRPSNWVMWRTGATPWVVHRVWRAGHHLRQYPAHGMYVW